MSDLATINRKYADLGLFQGQRLLVLDLEKCTRCDECVKACADSHDGVTRLVREGQRFGHFLVPISCRSCHDPQCLNGCPVDSIHRGEKSLEIRIEDHCIGCGLCANNCPFGSIHMVERSDTGGHEIEPDSPESRMIAQVKKQAKNCDLCEGSWTGPKCVHACPHDAAHRAKGEEVLAMVLKRIPAKK